MEVKFFIFFCLSVLLINTSAKKSTNPKICNIVNKQTGMYMYTPSSPFEKRQIYAWIQFFKSSEFWDDVQKGVWILEPVPKYNYTYYIRSHNYPDEYLTVGERFNHMFVIPSGFRYVYTIKPNVSHLGDESFMWEFYKDTDSSYQIYNYKLDEPLVLQPVFKQSGFSRRVFTSRKNGDYVLNDWFVRCKVDHGQELDK